MLSCTPCVIREATHADIAQIAALGKHFFDAAGWADVATWCPVSIGGTLTGMVDADMSILLVAICAGAVVGMAGAVLYPAYFNINETLGSELFWWVDPEHRSGAGALMLDAMEARAAELGCNAFIMSAVAQQRPETMARLYARRGYAPAEQTFIKAL